MRYFLALCLISLTANAEEEPFDLQVACVNGDIVVAVAMRKPGVLTFQIPHNHCGQDL